MKIEAEIKIIYEGHKKFLTIETKEVVLYGEEMKTVFGLAKEWECVHKITEDSGLRIWRFEWNKGVTKC